MAITIPPEIQAKVAETQRQQAAEDAIGMNAATTALPGPTRDIYAVVPNITAGPFSVRRFVDRDFIFLAMLDHPLNRFTAMADGSYTLEPTGPLAWQLFWLLTRPVSEVKEQFKHGAESVKEAAADTFGELQLYALADLLTAAAKQMTIYASAHLEYEAKTEGENGGVVPPSS